MHPEAEELKKQGNDCVKDGKPAEAILHYTHAVKLDPNNHLLYSNRSLAFLKLQQFYHAQEDAKSTIKLQPKWPKGYFRKGEAEFAAEHYRQALISYEQGLALDPEDEGLQKARHKTALEWSKQKKAEKILPFKGIGAGLAFGLLIILADELLTKQPSIPHVILKILLVATFAGIGYGISYGYRYITESQRKALLDPPYDILADFDKSSKSNKPSTEESNAAGDGPEKHRRRGGAGAARHRYKKGKS